MHLGKKGNPDLNCSVKPKSINLLIIDGNSENIHLIRGTLKNRGKEIGIFQVANGFEALAFLRKEDCYEQVPRPNLILLDLNIPGMDGREVLIEIRKDPDLMQIPLIALTESCDAEGVFDAYDLSANCCINRPSDCEQFIRIVEVIDDFWLTHVHLPA